jgi:hypothetical protein
VSKREKASYELSFNEIVLDFWCTFRDYLVFIGKLLDGILRRQPEGPLRATGEIRTSYWTLVVV